MTDDIYMYCVCQLSVCRHRSALGECVASFASTFPVAFLEAQFNKFNRNSILFGIAEEDIATHSLEAKGKRQRLSDFVGYSKKEGRNAPLEPTKCRID